MRKLMKSRLLQSGAEQIFDVISWAALIAAFFVLVLFLNARMDTLLDSDMSSELVLSRLLAQQGKIMTPDWYYSSELRVLNTQLFYAFWFRITSNWHYVRILANACMYFVMIASYAMLCRALHCEKYFAITAALLVLPFSYGYFDYVLKGAYYIPHITITFLSLALMERYRITNGQRAKIYLGLNIALAVIAGMGGPRQIVILYMPLAAAALMLWIGTERDKKKQRLPKLIGALTIVLGAGIGYILNVKLLVRHYHFLQWDSIEFVELDFTRLAQILNGFFVSYGYSTGKLFSKGILITNIVCAFWVAATVTVLYYMLRHRKEVSDSCYRLAVFEISAIGIYILLYLFTDLKYSDRYNLPILVLTIPLYAASAECIPIQNRKKKALLLCFAGLVCLNSAVLYRDVGKQDNTAELRVIQQQMLQQEYQAGYSTFWKANVMTELSNGKIEMWDWCDGGFENVQNIDQTYPWLQLVEHDDKHPEGKVFLLFSQNEIPQCTWYARLNPEHLIYSSGRYVVLGYESYEAMRAEAMPQDAEKK